MKLFPANNTEIIEKCRRYFQFNLPSELIEKRLVRQQDAYLAIRPAYPRGCCPRAAKGDKTYLQAVFLRI